MISVDITAINELKLAINKAASDSNDTLAMLRRVFEEAGEDDELKMLPQYEPVNDSIVLALGRLDRTEQCLQSLKNILATVDEEYCDIENESVNAIRRMADYLSKYNSQHS